MEDGHYVIGVIGNILDEKHYRAMGSARWLFDWLVFRQTKPNGSVLGGQPVKDEVIHAQTGWPLKRIRAWREILEHYPYIKSRRTPYGTVYRVLKPKKFSRRQIALPIEEVVPKNGHLPKKSSARKRELAPNVVPVFGNPVPENGKNKEDSQKTTINADSQKTLVNSEFELTSAPDDPPSPDLLLKIWQDEHGPLPGVMVFSDNRVGKCRARLNAHAGKVFSFLEEFRRAVNKAAHNVFLCGGGRTGWKATFDWFIENDRNYAKVLEGNYDGERRRANAREALTDSQIKQSLANLGLSEVH